MAGIGRPKGQRGHNPVRAEALSLFSAWRDMNLPFVIDVETAFEISDGVVDVRAEQETISLSAVALRTAIHRNRK